MEHIRKVCKDTLSNELWELAEEMDFDVVWGFKFIKKQKDDIIC